MSQGYIVIITKLLLFLGLKCSCVIRDDLDRAPEPRQDVSLQKLNDDCVDSLARWDFFDPFGEVICSHKYPFVLR